MSDDGLFNLAAWFIAAAFSVFLLWVFVFALPATYENERHFVETCTKAGGVPSKYETMVGKTSHSERLCIKKENIVEIGND